MTQVDVEKFIETATVEQLNQFSKKIRSKKKEKKNVAPAEVLDVLISLEKNFGLDALKIGIAARRKVWKASATAKAEADLASIKDSEVSVKTEVGGSGSKPRRLAKKEEKVAEAA